MIIRNVAPRNKVQCSHSPQLTATISPRHYLGCGIREDDMEKTLLKNKNPETLSLQRATQARRKGPNLSL